MISCRTTRTRIVTRSLQGMLAILLLIAPALAPAGAAEPGAGVLAGRWRATPDAEEEPIRLSFHREKQGEGRISVQLGPEGARFVGEYLRLDGTRSPGRVRVFYTTFSSDEFDRFRYGPAGQRWVTTEVTFDRFRARYSGAVVAKLIGNLGSQMRCHFDLKNPAEGMPGGANGRCQATTGDVIEVGRPAPILR